MNAMVRLDGFSTDASLPSSVREAASRHRAKLLEDGSRPSGEDPLSDAELIIAFIQGQIEAT
jgi:hypothetical protein